MLSQHSKKHHAGAPNIVPDPLVDPGNPPRRYQARSTAHPDRPRSRMVALAASSPGRCSPRSPQTNNATVMLGQQSLQLPAARMKIPPHPELLRVPVPAKAATASYGSREVRNGSMLSKKVFSG